MKPLVCAIIALHCCIADAQESIILFSEHFDSVAVPSLPRGWLTSTNRLPSGDFVLTASSVHSPPNTTISTNATVSQWLESPSIDCTGQTPDRLEFYCARSSSHNAALVVEASIDDGMTFPILLGDTLRNPGTTSYTLCSDEIPASIQNQPAVRFRWRLIAAPNGPTGTLRIDDVVVTARLQIPDVEPRTIVVNEIMYDPAHDQCEWIELYHRGTIAVDIGHWRISQRPTTSGTSSFVITNSSALIQPNDFVVIAADSTILSRFDYLSRPDPSIHLFVLNKGGGLGLNNDGDDVVLHDARGRTIDSVSYTPSWHHPDCSDPRGRSLERINPDLPSNDRRNWSSSSAAAGGTPGKVNGIFTNNLPANAALSVDPNPFSPDGDGFEDFCIVHYHLPLTTSLIRISIFDMKGRCVRRLSNCELSGSTGSVVWDGLDESRQRVRIGPYVVYCEAMDAEAGVLATAKTVVVVAAKF